MEVKEDESTFTCTSQILDLNECELGAVGGSVGSWGVGWGSAHLVEECSEHLCDVGCCKSRG